MYKILASVLLLASMSFGALKTWVASDSADDVKWANDANWDPSGTPGATDTAFFDASGGSKAPLVDVNISVATIKILSTYTRAMSFAGYSITLSNKIIDSGNGGTRNYGTKILFTGTGYKSIIASTIGTATATACTLRVNNSGTDTLNNQKNGLSFGPLIVDKNTKFVLIGAGTTFTNHNAGNCFYGDTNSTTISNGTQFNFTPTGTCEVYKMMPGATVSGTAPFWSLPVAGAYTYTYNALNYPGGTVNFSCNRGTFLFKDSLNSGVNAMAITAGNTTGNAAFRMSKTKIVCAGFSFVKSNGTSTSDTLYMDTCIINCTFYDENGGSGTGLIIYRGYSSINPTTLFTVGANHTRYPGSAIDTMRLNGTGTNTTANKWMGTLVFNKTSGIKQKFADTLKDSADVIHISGKDSLPFPTYCRDWISTNQDTVWRGDLFVGRNYTRNSTKEIVRTGSGIYFTGANSHAITINDTVSIKKLYVAGVGGTVTAGSNLKVHRLYDSAGALKMGTYTLQDTVLSITDTGAQIYDGSVYDSLKTTKTFGVTGNLVVKRLVMTGNDIKIKCPPNKRLVVTTFEAGDWSGTGDSAVSYTPGVPCTLVVATKPTLAISADVTYLDTTAPGPISYSGSPFVDTILKATSHNATNPGGTGSWSIYPPLPDGLAINIETGAITGTPIMSVRSSLTYSVICSGITGSDTCTIELGVVGRSNYLSLAKDTNAIQVGPSDTATIGVGNLRVKARNILNKNTQYRIRQSGTIRNAKIYLAATTGLTAIYAAIYRYSKTDSVYTLVGRSENVLSKLTGGAVSIAVLDTPIYNVREGDYTALRIVGDSSTACLYTKNHAYIGSKLYWSEGIALPQSSKWSGTGYNSVDSLVLPVEFYMDAPQTVFIGNSIIEGYPLHKSFIGTNWTPETDSISSTIEYQFYDSTGYTYQNVGFAAQQTGAILARITHDVIIKKPKYCIIEGGINDIFGGKTTAEIIGNFVKMADSNSAHGIKTMLIDVTPWNGSISTTARARQTDTVNNKMDSIFNIMPNCWSFRYDTILGQFRIGGDAGNLWDLQPQYTIDGIHLTKSGNAKISAELSKAFTQPSITPYKTIDLIGVPISRALQNSGGVFDSVVNVDALPTGYSLDKKTGIISGTPTIETGKAGYEITVYGINGTVMYYDTITITNGSLTITSISPEHGTTGIACTLRVTNAKNTDTLYWNGTRTLYNTSGDSLKIIHSVPVGTAGNIFVILADTSHPQIRDTIAWSYDSIPVLASIAPDSGNWRQSTVDTIYTTYGTLIDSVWYGDTLETISSQTAGKVIVTVRSAPIGTVSVRTHAQYGYRDTLVGAWRFVDMDSIPILSSSARGHSKLAGSVADTISTTYGTLIDSVWYGDSIAAITSQTANRVIVTVPAHPKGTVDIRSHALYGYRDTLVNAFEYADIYGVTISPRNSKAGTVQIIRAEYGLGTSGLEVTVGDSSAAVNDSIDTYATYIAPAYKSGRYDVVITNSAGDIYTTTIKYGIRRRGNGMALGIMIE